MAEDTKYRVEKNIAYYEGREKADYQRERCRLDLYHPDDVTDYSTVIWFHAGGMNSGERYVPGELQEQGIAVAAVDYRLSPRAVAPDYIEDAAAAVAWVSQHIEAYGGSPRRLIVAGASAGGYLAALIVLDKRWLAAHGMDADTVAGLASISGQAITHFTVRAEQGIPGERPVIDELAPLYHVRGDAPPILLATGDRELELLGRYEENAYFMRMLKVAGHPDVALHEIKGKDHGGVETAVHPLLLQFVQRIHGTSLPAD